MPHIYPHKQKGWRIIYRVWFPEGDWREKTRYSKKKLIAQQMLNDVSGLETHSRQGSVTREEIVFFLNRKYISQEEAERLSSSPLSVSMTWDDLRKAYEDYSRRNCAASSHICNMSKLDTLLKHFEKLPPGGVTEKDVEAYIDERTRKKIKSSTIQKEINTLRILLDPLGMVNPARQVKPPRTRDERVPVPLWRSDIIALYAAMKGHRRFLRGYLRPLVMTYLYAGLRPTEIINLRPQDVNLGIGRITVQGKDGVRTKTGRVRTVEIHPRLEVYLRACLRRGGKYIFGGEDRFLSNSVGRAIRNVLDDARKILAKKGLNGLEGATPYSLRHTFITQLLRAGADIREVMDRAGHSRLGTTMRYLHVAPSSKNSPVKRIKFKD